MIIISIIETKLIILFFVIKKLYVWMRLFKQLNFDLKNKYFILCDNYQIMSFMTKKKSQIIIKLKHIFINMHWLWQEVQAEWLKIHWVFTLMIFTNKLIKLLICQKYEKFVCQLNLKDISHLMTKIWHFSIFFLLNWRKFLFIFILINLFFIMTSTLIWTSLLTCLIKFLFHSFYTCFWIILKEKTIIKFTIN